MNKDLLQMTTEWIYNECPSIIKFKKLEPNATLPFKTHESDACWDVVATSKKYLNDEKTLIEYGLGFSLELPKCSQLDLRARSSIYKTGLILSNCIGTGDEDYRGEYKAVFYKVVPNLPEYEVGDKILQIQLVGRLNMKFVEVEELDETVRGEGGFGSTGN